MEEFQQKKKISSTFFFSQSSVRKLIQQVLATSKDTN